MKLTIICIGKTREGFVREGIEKYRRYLRHYADLQIRELREEKIHDLKEATAIRKKEAGKISLALPAGAYVIALDERGDEFTSHEFAEFLTKTVESGVREMVFVIGGAMGLDQDIRAMAQKTVALSRWTLTHEMARLVLLEQLYRAFTIMTGKTYHY